MYIRKKQMVVENGELKWKLVPIRFSGEAIEKLVDEAERMGYEGSPLLKESAGSEPLSCGARRNSIEAS